MRRAPSASPEGEGNGCIIHQHSLHGEAEGAYYL